MQGEVPGQEAPEAKNIITLPTIEIVGDPDEAIEEEIEEAKGEAGEAIERAGEQLSDGPESGLAESATAAPGVTKESVQAGVRAALRQEGVTAEDVAEVMRAMDRSTQEGQWEYEAAQQIYQKKVSKGAQASVSRPWYKFWS